MIQQSPVDDLLLKLGPDWGEKRINALKLLHAIGDDDRQTRLHRILSLAARSRLNDNLIPGTQILLPSSPKETCEQGTVTLGDVCFGYSSGGAPVPRHKLKLRTEDLVEHVSIAGRTGQAKTTLAYNMAIDLARHHPDKSLCVIDFNRTWRDMLSLSPAENPFLKNVRVYTVGREDIAPFAYNLLFSPPPGIPLEYWISIGLSKPLEKTMMSGMGSASLLSDAAEGLREAFQQGMQELLPNLQDLKDNLEKKPYQARELLWAQSAMRINRELTRPAVRDIFSSRNPINIAEAILERPGVTILELDLLLPHHIKQLFTEVFFYYMYLYFLTKGQTITDNLRFCLFIEEAMNVLDQSFQARRIGFNILHNLMREARKYGISLVLLGQEPSMFPNVLSSNVKTSIFFSSKSKRDIDAAANTLFLKPHQLPFIDLLTRGYCIAKVSGRTSNLLLKTPPPPFPQRISDDELRERAKRWQNQN
jgi:DNA helicase HerA-like ATPase